MKFIRSKMDYLKNEIIMYYKNNDEKIIKKKYKYNKLLPYNNLKYNKEDINILPYNYYDLKTIKFKNNKNIYENLYETKSELYNKIYNKDLNYEIFF